MIEIDWLIERDDDCDCPRWLRWRVVRRERNRSPDGGVKVGLSSVEAHAVTRLGARWKRWRLSR